MSTPDPKAAAEELLKQHIARSHFQSISEDAFPRDMRSAYAVQDAFVELRKQQINSGPGGWKIALTTPVMQAFVGIDHPLAGTILERDIHRSGAVLDLKNHVHLGVESELAVRISSDVTGENAPYDRESIIPHVGTFMTAMELVDDRCCNYKDLDPHLLIADNTFNEGCVLGPEFEDWHKVDLANVKVEMRINESIQGKGEGRDVLGHPLNALAWLSNHLLTRKLMLKRGDIVLTGSIVTTKWPRQGDKVSSLSKELGDAHLRLV